MTPQKTARELLSWFDLVARRLPWRENRDPYRVWVSEVMLQQTRVDVVVPFFLRFIDSFPSVQSLAKASIDEVLARWSGLGYYRRARLLHAASQQIVGMGGQFPTTKVELKKLPGFGEYTAAAVASIAFGEVVPVIDGNVERVLSRRLALLEDPKKRRARERLVAEAAGLLHPRRAGDSNQALMELGATICTPSRPRCGDCPLSKSCAGLGVGKPEIFPLARKKRQVEKCFRLGAVVEDRGRFLLHRRSESSAVLGGMWEVPWVEVGCGREAEAALGARYGARWELGATLGQVRHQITNRAFEVSVVRAQIHGGDAVAEGGTAGWFSVADLHWIGTTSLVKKILDLAMRSGGRPEGPEAVKSTAGDPF